VPPPAAEPQRPGRFAVFVLGLIAGALAMVGVAALLGLPLNVH
jgi:hypothetical protein